MLTPDGRRDLAALIIQAAGTAVICLLVDDAAGRAAQLRFWHAVRRGSWWVSAKAAEVGLRAEQRYETARY